MKWIMRVVYPVTAGSSMNRRDSGSTKTTSRADIDPMAATVMTSDVWYPRRMRS